jgi:hypothetical protein
MKNVKVHITPNGNVGTTSVDTSRKGLYLHQTHINTFSDDGLTSNSAKVLEKALKDLRAEQETVKVHVKAAMTVYKMEAKRISKELKNREKTIAKAKRETKKNRKQNKKAAKRATKKVSRPEGTQTQEG